MSKKILLITSTPDVGGPIAKFLKEMGYKAILSNEPRAATDLATRFQPDLILCQGVMPGLSGQDLARLFKANPALSAVPFLLLTNRVWEVAEMERADFVTAADDLVRLPITQTDLYGKVTQWLESESRPASVSQRVAGPMTPLEKKRPARSWRRGSIRLANIARLLFNISKDRETGVLEISSGRRRMKLLIANGAAVDVQSNYIREDTLGRYLIEQGKILRGENEASLTRAKKEGVPQGRMLVRLGFVTETELLDALTEQKTNKFLRLFDGSWDGGAFAFSVQKIETPPKSMLVIPAAVWLVRGIMEITQTEQVFDTFARNGKKDTLIFVGSNLNATAKLLHLEMAAVELSLWIDGKSVTGIRNQMAHQFDSLLRLAFLLLVSRAARFNGTEKSKTPDKPRSKAVPPRPPMPKAPPPAPAPSPAVAKSETWRAKPYLDALAEGRSQLVAKRYAKAGLALKKAVQANPDSAEALALLAWSNFQLGGASSIEVAYEAKEMLKRAVALDDENDSAHFYLGMILKLEGKEHLCANYFRKAHALNPTNEEAAREVKLLKIRKRKTSDFTYRR
jgi:DNA-binding response OmpR family regulator